MQNNMSPMTFSMDGPVIDGVWYNPKTGDKFTVRNSFFEDNQMVIQTMEGRIIHLSQMQDYVKSSDGSVPDFTPGKKTSGNEYIPTEVADLIEPEDAAGYDILPDDYELLKGTPSTSLGNLHQTQPVQLNENNIVISKALSKIELPDINVDIDIDKLPVSKIKALVDVMDVPTEDIAEWYSNQFDIDTIMTGVKKSITNIIMNIIYPVKPDIQPDTQSETPKNGKKRK